MIKQLKEIPVGGIFYLPQHPGNVYRHVSHGTKAEFVEHRLGNQYKGHELTMYPQQLVATEASDYFCCSLCDVAIPLQADFCLPCHALVYDQPYDHSLL
jgi:hypothetical protein